MASFRVAFSPQWQWEYDLDASRAKLVPEINKTLEKALLWHELGERMLRTPRFAGAGDCGLFRNTLLHHTLAVWSVVTQQGGQRIGEYAALLHDVPEVCGLGDISKRLKPRVVNSSYDSAEAGVWSHLVQLYNLPVEVRDHLVCGCDSGDYDLTAVDKDCGDYEYYQLALHGESLCPCSPRPDLDRIYTKTHMEAFNVWLKLLPGCD